MNEQEKRREVKRILGVIYFEWAKPITEDLVSYWLNMLRGVDKKEAIAAAKLLNTRKTFGEPKFQDFWQALSDLRASMPRPYNPWQTQQPERLGKILRQMEAQGQPLESLPLIASQKLLGR